MILIYQQDTNSWRWGSPHTKQSIGIRKMLSTKFMKTNLI
jgi:hypothetical protein